MARIDDAEDFEALWCRLAPHLRAALQRYRWTDGALSAEDLVQEARIRLWEVLSGDRKRRFGTSYYVRVINSAVVDCLRRHRGTLARAFRDEGDAGRDPLDSVVSELPTPDEMFGRTADRRRLLAALRSLPSARRRAVGLFLQGFSVPEIARLMDCDEHRAHNLAYRGIRALKDRMYGDEED